MHVSLLQDKGAKDVLDDKKIPGGVDANAGVDKKSSSGDGGGGSAFQTGEMADYMAIVAAVAAAAAVWGAVLTSRMICCRRRMTGVPVGLLSVTYIYSALKS